jgi:hypothetical protein
MPSVSKPQHNFMEAVDHNPAFAKKVGVPRKVGADFVAADQASGRYGATPKHSPIGAMVSGRIGKKK